MSRGKHLNGREPWKEYGLTKSAYYSRMRKGIPFDKECKRGRNPDLEFRRLKEDMQKAKMENGNQKIRGRFSGEVYTNPTSKINAIRDKYKNGVTDKILSELYIKIGGENENFGIAETN